MESSAISVSCTCILSDSCWGKRREMASWSSAVGLYFLFLKYCDRKQEVGLD